MRYAAASRHPHASSEIASLREGFLPQRVPKDELCWVALRSAFSIQPRAGHRRQRKLNGVPDDRLQQEPRGSERRHRQSKGWEKSAYEEDENADGDRRLNAGAEARTDR